MVEEDTGVQRSMPAVFSPHIPGLVDGKRPYVLGSSVMKQNLVFHPFNPGMAK